MKTNRENNLSMKMREEEREEEERRGERKGRTVISSPQVKTALGVFWERGTRVFSD